jgi:acyl-CoA-dependent ceramide synthase
MIAFVLSAWMGWSILLPDRPNPLDPFVKISYPLPRTLTESNTRYGKGALDLCFLSFYVIVFSFTRQASFEYLIKPLARYHNLRSETKMLRFQEQAYTCLYMGFFATVGLVRGPLRSQFDLRGRRSGSCPTCQPGGTRPSSSGSATRTGA